MSFSISGYVIGVDLGGSNLRAGLVDASGDAVAELAEPTVDGDAAAVVAQLGELGRRLADGAGAGWDEIAGIGVGVPGVLVRGALQMAPNLPPFGDLDLATALSVELGAAVLVDNDVNMATVGEHRHGLGDGVDDFVFVAVGTGVGMGIVSGGRLVRGAHGAAGEIGSMPLGDGIVEDAAGGRALERRYAERTGRTLSAQQVFAAGDAAAAAVLDEQARAVALAVAAVQTVLDPELVVIGGGIGSRDDFIARVRAHVNNTSSEPVRIEPSALGERAGVIGAAEAVRRADG
jgi:predicted NBD/HSP70 family sugar kinase